MLCRTVFPNLADFNRAPYHFLRPRLALRSPKLSNPYMELFGVSLKFSPHFDTICRINKKTKSTNVKYNEESNAKSKHLTKLPQPSSLNCVHQERGQQSHEVR